MKHRSRWWTAAELVGYVDIAAHTAAIVGWVFARSLATGPRDFMGDEREVSSETILFWWLLGLGLLAALAWLIVAVVKTYQRRRAGPVLLCWHGAVLGLIATPQMIRVLDPHGTAGTSIFAVLIWPPAALAAIVSASLLAVLRRVE